MRRPAMYLGGTSLFALGAALGLAVGSYSSHRPLASRPTPTSTIRAGTATTTFPNGQVTKAPKATSSPRSGDVTVRIAVRPNGTSNGVLVIPIPPPEPELCRPRHITVTVGQTALVACRSANYDGLITANIDDPAIATVVASGGRMLPRYLYIHARAAGTTTIRVSYPRGPTTSYTITVRRV